MAIISIKDSVQLYIGTGETLALTDAIGNKASIGDIGGDGAEEIDVTKMESQTKEYELGFEDPGSFDVTQFLTDDEYTKMATLKDAGTKVKWGVLFNNKAGETVLGLSGEGLVKTVRMTGLSVGSAVQVVTTIRCSGAISSTFEKPAA